MKTSFRLSLIALLAAFALVLLSSVALAEGEWLTTSEGINVWNPNPVEGEIASWTGDRDPEGYATGYGILRWIVNGKLEQTYQGKMLHGKFYGKGVYKWIEGTYYEGDFNDNEFSGKGLIYIPQIGLYKGDFLNGKMQGKGSFKFINGNFYEGDLANDKIQGKGIYHWINGATYSGDFVDGERTGFGIYTFPDGSRYEGEFVDGKFQGTGTLYNPDGDIKQQGSWENGNFIK
jgi:hypothetical protein